MSDRAERTGAQRAGDRPARPLAMAARGTGPSRMVLARPRLERFLDGALTHRLTLVTADPGFGKTTLLGAWSAGVRTVTYAIAEEDADLSRFVRHVVEALRLRVPDLVLEPAAVGTAPGPGAGGHERARPQALAELVGEALTRRLKRDLALVLDNAHLVADTAAAHFLADLVRHAPPLLHVVLSGRESPRLPLGRMAHLGQLLELHGADLAFTVAEVAELLTAEFGQAAPDTAKAIHEATAGWAVAVRLAVEALREVEPAARAGALESLAIPRQHLATLLETVYPREPAASQRILGVMALCGEVPVEMLEALGMPSAPAVLAGLARRGLFVERTEGGWYRLQSSARDFVAAQPLADDRSAAEIRAAAAGWLSAHGLPHAALRLLVAAGRHGAVATLLAEEGARLIADGHADAVLDAIDSLPADSRDARTDRLAGEALQLRGDWEAALACFERAAATDQALDAGLAWRMGLIHHLRGEIDEALAVYARGRVDDEVTPDAALLLAWTASAHWLRSDREACGDLAVRALSVARAVDDDQALAAAHTVLAMLAALDGDRRANDAHYLKALRHAERAGDALQRIRIHINRSSHHVEEGAYAEALSELDIAIGLADVSGFATFGALALSNRGETRLRLGRLEEARRDLEDSEAMFEALGSHLVSYPVSQLGALHHLRGDRTASRQAYERALERSEAAGDRQGQVPALAGLAALLADSDTATAARLAERAVDCGDGMAYVAALLSTARVALANGDRRAAVEGARAAGAVAQERRDRPGQAEAAEIEAAATDDDQEALGLADQAVELWAAVGDPIGQARAELVRAARLDRTAAAAVLRAVHGRTRALGCRLLATQAAAALDRLGADPAGLPRLETLGGFRVRHPDGTPADDEWRSRKAQQLLKMLVSRRGRPVPREWLMESLWPGEDPDRLANRFNVAMSTVRSVVDRGTEGDHGSALASDADAVRLVPDRVDIDVERFLDDATAGLRLLREGREPEARELLERAEAAYLGEFLEADLYEDWAVGLREEARFAYLEVASRLAALAEARGEASSALRYLLRVIEHDPYAEPTHLKLIGLLAASGRHGDARRHYRAYCSRMEELGVEAAPFPAV